MEDYKNKEEEAEIDYKAYLVNVTKKRKVLPSTLSKYLGHTLRIQSLTADAMKVNLETKIPLHSNQGTETNEELQNSCKEIQISSDTLNDLKRDVEEQMLKMYRFKDALQMFEM